MPNTRMSESMRSEPLQNVEKYCFNCDAMKINTADMEKLSLMRLKCMNCRKGSGKGIYKHDAIRTALEKSKELEQAKERLKEIEQKYQELKEKQEKQKSNLTPGRKPTAEKQYGKIIRSLRAEGKTLREINKMTGIAINTIRKCLAEK